ncbi:hypothetical protein DET0227 [Dehalococcoides mccartyi 195]|uniref:Uncharacterized protein n=1 Tax=Dehalococcoides mccartyi (strain ATCC BAA-2266 / KCTC 15142 / 195) TaxID=243164 RepID=Q3Z9X4_DEHM1|nr:hypothetical protein DET0227 [Dehalococcoides mccartyi 195]
MAAVMPAAPPPIIRVVFWGISKRPLWEICHAGVKRQKLLYTRLRISCWLKGSFVNDGEGGQRVIF